MNSPEINGINPFEELRLKTGQSRSEYAAALDVPYSAIYDVEKGLRPVPSDRLIEALRNLECDVDDLQRRYSDWFQREQEDRQAAIREKAVA